MMEKPSLGFIGAGKVGIPLARLWYEAGYRVAAIYSRNAVKAQELASVVGAKVFSSADEVVESADLTFLTVPDDAIQAVAAGFINRDLHGKAVVHTSGAHDAMLLSSLADQGAMIGSLHPVFPFADVDTAMSQLPGAVFALEAEDAVLRGWLMGLVEALRGHVIVIPAGQKALYHSALVFASNYTVTLYSIAERLLVELGADKMTADEALNGLLGGTIENFREKGIPDALTGPLVRGDTGTLAAHLKALEKTPFVELYRQLARLSFPMLEARQVDIDPIERIIRQSENHAIDHP